jgi:hypothetical protein
MGNVDVRYQVDERGEERVFLRGLSPNEEERSRIPFASAAEARVTGLGEQPMRAVEQSQVAGTL